MEAQIVKKIIQGRITLTSKGDGFVKIDEKNIDKSHDLDLDESVFIDHEHLNCAFHGDTVEIEILGKKKNEKTGIDNFYGIVLKIIERSKVYHAGKLEEENGIFFLIPDDKKTYIDFLIKKEDSLEAENGDKVICEINNWTQHKKSPFAKVIKILGKPGENEAEVLAYALERGFNDKHDSDVQTAAEQIQKEGIKPEDKLINENGIDGRRDFRQILTFTIDPGDAKDFDDALSFKKINNEGDVEIGIHIADVTHFIKPDDVIDKDAIYRQTSVYLVDRCVAMLPEVLSNDLCSLMEGQDRLVMSAVFILDKNANVKSEWYGRAIINSKKRFTYEEAQESILGKSEIFKAELQELNTLAKILTARKFTNGALLIETDEVKFKLDEKGVPVDVYVKERFDAHKLIEEFMVLANSRVCKFITQEQEKNNLQPICVYRIHDKPEAEKMHALNLFINSLGEKVKFINGNIASSELNKLLEKLKKENREAEKDLLSMHISRSMQKAIYSTKNVGHYGLALEYYSHFTSPIRRYPDDLTHRLLMRVLKKDWPQENERRYFEQMCAYGSKREKEAADAERGSIKYKQVEYMSYRVGQTFEGIVSGVSQWGIYVEEKKSRSEGMIRLRDLGDDFYCYNEAQSKIFGENSGEEWRIGDKVKIKVKSVDLEFRQIDYQLVK